MLPRHWATDYLARWSDTCISQKCTVARPSLRRMSGGLRAVVHRSDFAGSLQLRAIIGIDGSERLSRNDHNRRAWSR